MSIVSAPAVQYGRKKGSSERAIGDKEKPERNKLPDLRQVTILPKAEWLRIQESLNDVNKYNESLMNASKQREALHQQSKEMVKFWSNTIAGQRQKKLEAKKIREEIEEQERRQVDIEEAKYQEQKRKEAIEKAMTLQYYQTDRVKGFHSALMLTEVLKEREAQIKLKHRMQNARKDVDNEVLAMIACREQRALQQQQQKAQQRKQENAAFADSLKQQIKEHERTREQEKMVEEKEAEELQQLKERHLREHSVNEQKLREEKWNLMRAHKEHVANRDIIRAIEAQQQEIEEERRRLFASAKEKMMKLRKEKEAEIFRKEQKHREAIIDRLAARQQELATEEEELVAKAIGQQEARQAREQREKQQKHAAMLKSIACHREATRAEKELKEQEQKRKGLEMLHAKREADRVFLEKQQLKAQKNREMGKTLQDIYIHQMAEKRTQDKRIKEVQQDFEMKTLQLIAEEEGQFQQYAKNMTECATRAGRNTHALRKAAREGIGGGLGPVFGGVRPSYLVHDDTGVQMPSYAGVRAQDIKTLNETIDIQQSKKRLGLIW